jgi:hypothetical protein
MMAAPMARTRMITLSSAVLAVAPAFVLNPTAPRRTDS